jgi:hypothetical protein
MYLGGYLERKQLKGKNVTASTGARNTLTSMGEKPA